MKHGSDGIINNPHYAREKRLGGKQSVENNRWKTIASSGKCGDGITDTLDPTVCVPDSLLDRLCVHSHEAQIMRVAQRSDVGLDA